MKGKGREYKNLCGVKIVKRRPSFTQKNQFSNEVYTLPKNGVITYFLAKKNNVTKCSDFLRCAKMFERS